MTQTDKDVPVDASQDAETTVDSSELVDQNESDDEKYRALEEHYQARIDEVADLITRVRHEINNPLTGVLGQAQLLLREDLSDKARQRAVTIEELAIRIRDIVAQLRQIQKV